MHGDMGNWGWSMMAFMPLLWLGVPALIAWAVWAASRPRREPATPLDLLKESYARGEITRDEFQQTKEDLT
jgi:putative membrane protein